MCFSHCLGSKSMKTIDVVNNGTDEKKLMGIYARDSDATLMIDDDVIVTENGVPILVYIASAGIDTAPFKKILDNHKFKDFNRARRVGGFKSKSVSFGFKPRAPLRRQPCSLSGLSRTTNGVQEIIEQWTKVVTSNYERCLPEKVAEHLRIVDEVIRDYRLAGTVFTSGIVNQSSQLPYHFDSGNFEGAWSAMLGMKSGVDGGRLVIPKYGLSLGISDGSMTFFDGQNALHGVTPIMKTKTGGHRYTVVWYSIQQMWKCLTTEDELDSVNGMMDRGRKMRAGLIPESRKDGVRFKKPNDKPRKV